MPRHWNGEMSDETVKCDTFIVDGFMAGTVMQFPANAPTTYAHAGDRRLGAFESWEAAKVAVEKSVALRNVQKKPFEDTSFT